MQLVDTRHRLAVPGDDYVALGQAGIARGAARFDRHYAHTAFHRQIEVAHHTPRQQRVLPGYADVPASDPTMPQQLAYDQVSRVDCCGEADALRRHDDRGIDADHFAARVHEWSAGIARIERGIGLDHVVDQTSGLRTQAATQCAHDPGRDRALESIRVADGDRDLACCAPCARITWMNIAGSSGFPNR